MDDQGSRFKRPIKLIEFDWVWREVLKKESGVSLMGYRI